MKITINRADPFDDTMATAIFHHKDWAGDWILETINTAVADGGGSLWLEELLELNTQQIVIPQSDARYVKLDIYAIAVNNGRRVYVNVEIQLENTIIMTDRSFLHLADILNRYSQDLKGASTVDFYKGFPYLIAINLLDYVIPEISGDVHEVIKLCDVNTGKPATDKVEIHNIQLPQLTSENFDPARKLHLLVGALQKLRGKIANTAENATMLATIAEFEQDSKGYKQLAERFKIVRGYSDKEVEDMTTANTAKASPLESYMTIEEWREVGREQGREQGRQEITRTAVINLKRAKTPDDVIAQAFSLPIEQVREIHA